MGARTVEPGDPSIRIAPFGTAGFSVDLGISAHPMRAERTGEAARALELAFPGADVVRGAGTVALFFSGDEAAPTHDEISRALRKPADFSREGRTHELPVVYDGPDLDELARGLHLARADIVALHSGQEFVCELIGFMPGFAYLGTNPAPLVVPRRATPRPRVLPGSVALAGAFSAVYPFESPGGWHLIGRSVGPPVFDPKRAEPSLFSAGDRVRFVPVAPEDDPRASRTLDIRISLRLGPPRRGLTVVDAPLLTSLQDEGRPGALSLGIPPSGALVPAARRRAERAAGNSRRAASLEIVAGVARVRAVGRVRVALDDGKSVVLDDGETLFVSAGSGWVRYLAIAGGFDGDQVLGSRATLASAGLGGHGGRLIKKGDFLAVLEEDARDDEQSGDGEEQEEARGGAARVFVDPGPHAAHFASDAFERLLESEYEVSPLSNRVGQRLLGPKVERLSTDTLLPTPMIRGVIEVPASGEPIVLGPDHPTTGGYPVLAVVRPESWGTMGSMGPGSRFRFAVRSRG